MFVKLNKLMLLTPANRAVFLCMRSNHRNIKISITISEVKGTLSRYCIPRTKVNTTLLFHYKKIFYKNVEAEICEILKTF